MGITVEYLTLINLTIRSALKFFSFVKIFLKLKKEKHEKEIFCYLFVRNYLFEISLFTIQEGERERRIAQRLIVLWLTISRG